MPRPRTFTETLIGTLRAKFWEPELSTRDLSVREMRTRGPHRIYHRFPIKNGLTVFEAMRADSFQQENALYRLIKERSGAKSPK